MDPNMDPEIAEAIRMSLEEEKERVDREKQKQDTKQPQKMEVYILISRLRKNNWTRRSFLIRPNSCRCRSRNRSKRLSMTRSL